MSWTFTCRLLDVCLPRYRVAHQQRDHDVILAAPVNRFMSMPQVVSAVRSQLWGSELGDVMPKGSSTQVTDAEIRRCVRDNRERWSDVPPAIDDENVCYAYFHLTWKPAIVFDKVQQNRLYQVLLGDEPKGRLRRPRQAGGWLYMPEGATPAEQIGPWDNLEQARHFVEQMLKSAEPQPEGESYDSFDNNTESACYG